MKTLIRNLSTIFFITMVLGASSCKKDNDGPASIVCKWYLKSEIFRTYINGHLEDSEETTSSSLSDYIEFKRDGTGVSSNKDEGTQPFTYSINNERTQLTLVDDEDSYTVDIKKLSSRELVLGLEEEFTLNSELHKYIFEITYRK